ncbi:MAG: DNA replication/repair protein RecF [Candidatus Babeliales bacterium]
MLLTQLHLKHFRCFSDLVLNLEKPLVIIEGFNGCGKTSFLEAVHYLCYLRSFRTHTPRELIQFGHEGFFIKALFTQHDNVCPQELQVGFSGKRRLVKINQKPIESYKELMDFYRIVTLTESDLDLIHGDPETRRAFIDQAIMLYDPAHANTIRDLRHCVEQRNALLQRSVSSDEFNTWTEQLFYKSVAIQDTRRTTLVALERTAQTLIADHFDNAFSIGFEYKAKRIPDDQSYETFRAAYPHLLQEEQKMNRSLFGAHVDDILITFHDKRSKQYASRGQQKLIVLLIKIAQIKELLRKKGPAVFLLDDFMTDFDERRIVQLLTVLRELDIQLIFTTPLSSHILTHELKAHGAQTIKLPH